MSAVIRYEKLASVPRSEGSEARIQIVSGPDEGTTYKITGNIVRFGRHVDNEIILQDLKASRFHAEIVMLHQRYILKDLNSQNGVFINNQRVIESELRSGDFMSIGNSVFKFVEFVQAPLRDDALIHIPSVDEVEKKNTFKKVGTGILFGLITVMFIQVYFSKPKSKVDVRRTPTSVTPHTPSIFSPPYKSKSDVEAQASDHNQDQARVLYHQGYREYFSGNYERAIGLFQACLGLDRQHQLGNIYLRRSYQKLDKEVKRRFDSASIFVSALQFKEARREFKRIVEILDFYPESKVYQSYYFKSKEFVESIERKLASEQKGYF